MECLVGERKGCDLGDDVVQLAIPYSDLYYLDLIVCHGRRGGGPRVGNETSRARRRSGCNVCRRK